MHSYSVEFRWSTKVVRGVQGKVRRKGCHWKDGEGRSSRRWMGEMILGEVVTERY